MAQLSKSAFLSKWNNLFLNNKTGKITEARMREFTTDIQDSFVSALEIQTVPALPDNVSWVEIPTSTISGNSLSISDSKLNINGAEKTIPAKSGSNALILPYASSGNHRLDAIVLDYTAVNPVYLRLAGDEVPSYATALRPIIPPNYLFVQDADVSDGQINQTTTGYVKKISINGGTPFNADVNGLVDLLITALGGVQTISINGGAPFAPDGSGLVNLTLGALGHIIQSSSTTYSNRANLKFLAGTGITVAINDNVAGNTTEITISANAIASLLTGYAVGTTNRALSSSDSILIALGVLEKRINDNTSNLTGLVSGIQATFNCTPDTLPSEEVCIVGVVTSVGSENRTAVDGSVPASGAFAYQYRLSSSGSWSTNQNFSQITTQLITASSSRIIFVRAVNTVSTIPSTVTFNLTKN